MHIIIDFVKHKYVFTKHMVIGIRIEEAALR